MDASLAPPKEYRNLDLSIQRRGDGLYDVVATGPRGSVTRCEGAEIKAPPTADGKTAGQQLFQSVFQGEILASFRRVLGQARDAGDGLRLRLRLDTAPELAAYPWELLYDPEDQRHLGHSNATPIVRYLEMRQPHVPLTVDLPLRVLVVASSPRTLYPLDTEAEWRQLKEALADLECRRQVVLRRLQSPTRDALQRTIRQQPPHVIHFIGHGDISKAHGQETGVVFLETEEGDDDAVSGELLGILLHDAKPKLVVLNSCRSATPVPGAHLSGVAEALLRQDVPAVVGMVDEIADDDAQVLARHVYAALADGLPVDAALGEARKALALRNDSDVKAWSLPRLFLRCDDGVLFRLPTTASSEPKTPSLQGNQGSKPPWQRPFTLVALLGMILTLAGWGAHGFWSHQTVRQLNGQALQLLEAQRLDDARKTIQEAIDQKPSHAPSWSNLGMIEDADGRSQEALEAYRRAVQLRPEEALHRFNYASALLSHGRYEPAMDELQAVLRLEPEHGPAHNDLGWTLLELGRHDDARPRLAQGLQLDDLELQTRAALHKNYGRLSFETDDLSSAERHLVEALQHLDPAVPKPRLEARLLLAATRSRQGDAVGACRHLQQFARDGGLLYRWHLDPQDLSKPLQCPVAPTPSSTPFEPTRP